MHEFIDIERTIGRLRVDRTDARVHAHRCLAMIKQLEQDRNGWLPDFVTGSGEEKSNIEDAYARSSQESSWCPGFSDREESDYAELGVVVKVVVGKITECWNAARVIE